MADDEIESNEQQSVIEGTNRDSKDDENVMFYFLYKIIKKKILKRHKVGDVCTFSSWLRALEQCPNKKVRYEYTQLMILALEYPEPVCPFKDPPPETIDPLEHGVIETSRRFRNREGTATCTPIDTRISNPTITTSVTHNNCRFASSQIIPNVGVQVYYAYSDEPLYKWYIPPQITVPKKGPHAGPLEWERAIAGIMPKWNKLKVENPILLNTQINMDEKKEELASVNGSKISEAKSDRARANEKPDICNVMNIEQQNRNVTENFGWNDASILTGEKIIGAEMCSDYKMDGQVKSQIELDEEAASAFDKLYPGDFRIHVDYSVVDVLVPMNKMISMEAGDKRITKEKQHELCDEKSSSKPRQCSSTTDVCADSKNALRQNAGQESTRLSVDCGPKGIAEAKNRNRKISKLSAHLNDLTVKSQTFKTRKNVDPECPKTIIESPKDELSQRRVSNTNELFDDPESSSGKKCTLQKDLLSTQNEADCIEESSYDGARSLSLNDGKELENSDQDYESLDGPLDL